MKKVILFTGLLLCCSIGQAQVQTINSQLKLGNVQPAGVNDTLILVQGPDKIVRKVNKSSLVPEPVTPTIPSLQEVTNNGNVTSHPIHAKEFRVDSNVDSLAVFNNRFLSFGDLGNDYNGNWNKFFSVFDPQNYEDGFSMYAKNSSETKTIDVTAYAGFVRLSPWFDSPNNKRSELVMQDNIFYQGSGNKIGTLIGNYTQYFGEAMLGVIEDNLVYRTYSDPEASDYTNWLRIHPSENAILLDAGVFVLNENVQLTTSNVTEPQLFEFPEIGGTLATQEWISNEVSFDLQTVTDMGNATSNSLIVVNTDETIIGAANTTDNTAVALRSDGSIDFGRGVSEIATIRSTNITGIRSLELPDASGELLVQKRDFDPYGNYSFGGLYSGYSDLREFKFQTLGNGVDGLNGGFILSVNPEEGISLSGTNNTSTSASIRTTTSNIYMDAYDSLGNSGYDLSASQFAYTFTSTSDGNDTYNFIPASKTRGSETNNYYMPTVSSGHLAIIGDSAPASATASGVVGEIRVTDTYVYVCVAENTWRRAALSSW